MSKEGKSGNQNYTKAMVMVFRVFAVQKIRAGVNDRVIINGGNLWL